MNEIKGRNMCELNSTLKQSPGGTECKDGARSNEA